MRQTHGYGRVRSAVFSGRCENQLRGGREDRFTAGCRMELLMVAPAFFGPALRPRDPIRGRMERIKVTSDFASR
jgi:hypothetical protein